MSCTMNDPLTIHEAFPEDTVAALKSYLQRAEFKAVPLGDDVEMYAAIAPQEVTDTILKLASEEYGQDLESLQCFCRYNSPDMDTTFRIHSDGEILGEQPTIAAVYYVNSGDTGTALFTHHAHGNHPRYNDSEHIFTEDDSEWILTDYVEQKENTMFLYDARQFHSRWPQQSDDHRFTVVAFMKEK